MNITVAFENKDQSDWIWNQQKWYVLPYKEDNIYQSFLSDTDHYNEGDL